ncbi:MAG: biotin--[acetyl-CoA-carboxylase] ligase [bacterium]
MLIGKEIICYSTLDSTNDEAKRLIGKGLGEGGVVVADEQTAGRGKPGRSWFSPKGSGLYLSAIVKPHKNPKDLGEITMVGARAVVALIEQVADLPAEIKFPNDVLVAGKKICGILTERLASGHVIMGIGLNVNLPQDLFLPELKNSATSLFVETQKTYEIKKLSHQLIVCLDKEYQLFL